jgi:hypothetical protein
LPGAVTHAEPAPGAAYDVGVPVGWMEPAAQRGGHRMGQNS